MVITYNGLEFFKVQSGNLTLVFNPVSKNSKTKITPPRFKSDIALITLDHPDFNGVESLSGKDEKQTFIIDGPGEYEIQDVFIKGFASKSDYGGKESINTIYKVVMEGINLCFLGVLSEKNIPDDVLAELDGTEILFVPIGGGNVLNSSEAYKLSVKISPNVIIPMHYGNYGDKDALKKFLKEEGIKDLKSLDKLTAKKSNLALESGKIIVLESSNN
jgi:L-ascorbate metabolism protein UlaG (beta-lactamase superfamily)